MRMACWPRSWHPAANAVDGALDHHVPAGMSGMTDTVPCRIAAIHRGRLITVMDSVSFLITGERSTVCTPNCLRPGGSSLRRGSVSVVTL